MREEGKEDKAKKRRNIHYLPIYGWALITLSMMPSSGELLNYSPFHRPSRQKKKSSVTRFTGSQYDSLFARVVLLSGNYCNFCSVGIPGNKGLYLVEYS